MTSVLKEMCRVRTDLPEQPSVPAPSREASGGAPSQAEEGARGRAHLPAGPSQQAAPPAPPRGYLAAAEGGRGRRCAASRGWVGERAGDTPAASAPFPAWSAARAAGAAVRLRVRAAARRRPLLARPGASAPLLAGGECGAPARGRGLTFPGRRGGGWGRRGGPQDQAIEGSLVEGTWARRAGVGSGSGRLGARPGPAWTLGGASEVAAATPKGVPRVKALPAGGRGRGLHLRPPWEPHQHPQHRTGTVVPPSPGF